MLSFFTNAGLSSIVYFVWFCFTAFLGKTGNELSLSLLYYDSEKPFCLFLMGRLFLAIAIDFYLSRGFCGCDFF